MSPKYTPDNYPYVMPPYEHQRTILNETWKKRDWALFMEMGTGKSKVVCDNLGLMYLNGAVEGMVVVAKKGEYLNWKYSELPTHMPDVVPFMAYGFSTYYWRTRPGKDEWKKLMNFDGLKVLVINIEAFGTGPANDALNAFFKVCNKKIMFVVDESTCIKNHKAQRSKELYKWSAKALMRRIMTGLPNPQSPLDLWGQSLALNKGLLGTTNFTAFRGKYAIMEDLYLGSRTVKQITGYKNLLQLNENLKQFSHILAKEDCLDLPEKIYKKIAVELTSEQRVLMDAMKDELMLWADHPDQVTVTNALGLLTKLHQITCGQLKLDSGETKTIKNNRIDALMDILEDHQGKAIIWSNYRQTLQDVERAVAGRFGPNAMAGYHGGTDQKERPDIIKRFQDVDSDLRFLIANPQSAGYGLTLVSADLAIYYSNGYNLEHRLQSEDRIHRIGQTKRPVYIDLYVPGTIDEAIMTALREKRNLAELVMSGKFNPRQWI